MKKSNKSEAFCACCGETHPALLARLDKPKTGYLCQSCLHGSLHNHGECPAAKEHYRVKFFRIGHFMFDNCEGQVQTIIVRTHKTGDKISRVKSNNKGEI